MSKPRRIQLRRTRGWRKPAGAVVVSRPSKWGNPFKAPVYTKSQAVVAFASLVASRPRLRAEIRRHLRGKDLCCWCPLDGPCHADVLLEVANA